MDDDDIGLLTQNDTVTTKLVENDDDNGVQMNVVPQSGKDKMITFKIIASLPKLKSTEIGNWRQTLAKLLPSWNITSDESMAIIKMKDDAKKKKAAAALKKKQCQDEG